MSSRRNPAAFAGAGATNAHRSLHRTWKLMAPWADLAPDVPARTIVGDKDLVAGMPEVFDRQPRWLPQGRPTSWLGNRGHFAQIETPDKASRHVTPFLRDARG